MKIMQISAQAYDEIKDRLQNSDCGLSFEVCQDENGELVKIEGALGVQSFMRFDNQQYKDREHELFSFALEVVTMLDKQKEYFKTRDRQALIESKALEGKLRTKADGIIAALRQKFF